MFHPLGKNPYGGEGGGGRGRRGVGHPSSLVRPRLIKEIHRNSFCLQFDDGMP